MLIKNLENIYKKSIDYETESQVERHSLYTRI